LDFLARGRTFPAISSEKQAATNSIHFLFLAFRLSAFGLANSVIARNLNWNVGEACAWLSAIK
jgi:hypothetical protein